MEYGYYVQLVDEMISIMILDEIVRRQVGDNPSPSEFLKAIVETGAVIQKNRQEILDQLTNTINFSKKTYGSPDEIRNEISTHLLPRLPRPFNQASIRFQNREELEANGEDVPNEVVGIFDVIYDASQEGFGGAPVGAVLVYERS